MKNEIVDVDYTEVYDNDQGNQSDIIINTSPEAAIAHEFASVIKGFSNDIKEYKIAKEQELTKRAEIKANMKIAIAQIDAKKEMVIKYLENQHERDMAYISTYNKMILDSLDGYINSINIALECAREENDFSDVIMLLDKLNEFTEMRSKYYLEIIDKNSDTGISGLLGKGSSSGYLM